MLRKQGGKRKTHMTHVTCKGAGHCKLKLRSPQYTSTPVYLFIAYCIQFLQVYFGVLSRYSFNLGFLEAIQIIYQTGGCYETPIQCYSVFFLSVYCFNWKDQRVNDNVKTNWLQKMDASIIFYVLFFVLSLSDSISAWTRSDLDQCQKSLFLLFLLLHILHFFFLT